MTKVRDIVAIVRDVLLIVVLIAVLFFGWNVVKAVGEMKDGGKPAVVTPPLPQDKCGGGVC